MPSPLADPFMFQDYYGDRTSEQLAKEFGPQFAVAVVKLKPGSWQGPIESGYGWHLVFVDSVIPGRIPAFEEIEPDVKTAWLAIRSSRPGKRLTGNARQVHCASCLLRPRRKSASAAAPPPKKQVPTSSGEGPL